MIKAIFKINFLIFTTSVFFSVSHYAYSKPVPEIGTLKLFRKKDKVPTSPFLEIKFEIKNNKAVIDFNNIPYGEYAAILVHDKNQNGKIDHKFFFPNEPLGFTNNWKLSLFSGMPNFKKLKFVFSEKNSNFRIIVQN